MLTRTWLAGARARRQAQRALRPLGPVDALVEKVVEPGKSFLDVGALWGVHGKRAFMAEEQGASEVTAIDVLAATPEFEAERERRDSKVRFVYADLHADDTPERVGRHDIVWCSGVLYHCPNPVHSIACLRRLTRERLGLVTASIPEVPGIEGASIFFPHLSETARRSYDRAYDKANVGQGGRIGLSTPFAAEETYGNWWWGLTPSAITGMLRAEGFEIEHVGTNGFHTRVIARVAG
jgi:SAM-dependent methyltransferase